MAQRYWGNDKQQSIAEQVHVPTDTHLPANCYTLGRFGSPKEGIVLSLDRGPDEFRPWQPHVLVGSYRVQRDARDGCLFVKQSNGKTALVRRAIANWVQPDGKRSFYTLKAPGAEKVGTTLLKVNTTLPGAKTDVHVNGHDLRLFAGVDGGTLVGRDGFESLVELVESEVVTVFYEDGAVRSFRRQGVVLEERVLGTEDMLTERIQNAWTRLECAEAIEDGEKRTNIVRGILTHMADLFHLTTRFNGRGLGQGMRVRLMKEFFLELTPEALQLCHRKVTAILHQVDPALISMLYTSSVETPPVALPEGVASIADARDKRERAQRDAHREGLRKERLAMQPKKGPGGQKNKATTNPKKLEKLERKRASRK